MERIKALSTVYVRADISANQAGVAIDPTSDTVRMALMPNGADPGSSDWLTASWETNATTTPDTYTARCLVGPAGGTITLTKGVTYTVYVKITDSPEVPVLTSGPIAVV